MKLEGKIWKSSTSRYWLAEVRDLDVVTEGTSPPRRSRDASRCYRVAGESGRLSRQGRNGSRRSLHDRFNNDAVLVAFMLRALRAREGLSVREVASRLGAKLPNAYAQYETGRVAPSIDTLSRLLAALNPEFDAVLRVA